MIVFGSKVDRVVPKHCPEMAIEGELEKFLPHVVTMLNSHYPPSFQTFAAAMQLWEDFLSSIEARDKSVLLIYKNTSARGMARRRKVT